MFILVGFITYVQAKPTPANLYEQLCEVNQEWYKYRSTAESLGLVNAPKIENEQDLLVFHIQTLEKIFLNRAVTSLTSAQQLKRKRMLALEPAVIGMTAGF